MRREPTYGRHGNAKKQTIVSIRRKRAQMVAKRKMGNIKSRHVARRRGEIRRTF